MPRLFTPVKPLRVLIAATAVVAAWATPLSAWSQGEVVSCGGDSATIVGTRGHDVLTGTRADDVIHAAGGNDIVDGGAGDDRICGGRGVDHLHGSSGDDTLYGGRASDAALEGGEGGDRLFGGRGNDPADGGAGADYIDGGLGDDRLDGGAGDDIVIGNHGSDSAGGGPGEQDAVRGDLGHDRLDGGLGEADVVSFAGASEGVAVNLGQGFAKGEGQDHLGGFEAVVDSAFSGSGPSDEATVVRRSTIDRSTSLAVGGSASTDEIALDFDGSSILVYGGTGFQPEQVGGCDAAGSSGAVRCGADLDLITVSTGDGDDTVHIGAGLPPYIEVRIDGGPGADAIYGGGGSDVIEAGDDSAADLLSGGGGDDALIAARTDRPVPVDSGGGTMLGGSGDDVLVGGDPCDGDVYDGGPGADNANFFRFTPGVNAQIGGVATRAGEDCLPGRVLGSIEAIEGSPGPDVLVGDGRPNTISGGAGDDVLDGRGGRDRLVGGSGWDQLLAADGGDAAHQ